MCSCNTICNFVIKRRVSCRCYADSLLRSLFLSYTSQSPFLFSSLLFSSLLFSSLLFSSLLFPSFLPFITPLIFSFLISSPLPPHHFSTLLFFPNPTPPILSSLSVASITPALLPCIPLPHPHHSLPKTTPPFSTPHRPHRT